jgi:hypothetical protein
MIDGPERANVRRAWFNKMQEHIAMLGFTQNSISSSPFISNWVFAKRQATFARLRTKWNGRSASRANLHSQPFKEATRFP